MKRSIWHVSIILPVLFLIGCSLIPAVPSTVSTTPTPNSLVYDAPVSLNIRNGTVLPGTTIGYGGKTATGSAKLIIAGQVAAKQIGDSLDWQGSPVPNSKVNLATRLVTYDEQSATLVGTAHIEITNSLFQPGGTPPAKVLEFGAPVTYSIAKPGIIPGTNVTYMGPTEQGAQFAGIAGYPYRKQLDSLEYVGRVNPKVFLHLNLRVLNYTETGVLVGGTATIKMETP